MTETMKGVVLVGNGDMDQLVWREDLPKPTPNAGEVLIKVRACGLNNTDVNTRTAWYSKSSTAATTGGALEGASSEDATWGGAPIAFPRIQGADVCGEVVGLGDGVDPSIMGRRVLIDTWFRDSSNPLDQMKYRYFGSEIDGGFAEFTVAPIENTHPIESPLSDAELATFATSYITAEYMLVRAGVGEGDVVLITGASGGVGSALIQLANRRGAKTVGLASEAKWPQLEPFEPTALLPRTVDDLPAALTTAIGAPTVTVVADLVGGPAWPPLIEVLARGGRYVVSGAIAGPIVSLDLRTLYLQNLTFFGATFAPPGVMANLVGYIERGEIKPVLAATYPLKDLKEAQQAFIDKRHVGNIVVTP